DTRKEEEIVRHILSHRPVAHQKNVWAFWDKGWDALQPWKRRNVIDWIRRLGPEWDVRVLDVAPDSPRNVCHFVDVSLLPPAFTNFEHEHAGQHKADILRVLLLYLHGGVWMDLGGILLGDFDEMWNKIVDPTDPVEVVGLSTAPGKAHLVDRPLGNTFIVAAKGSLFMRLWHEVFSAVMKDRTTSRDVRLDPLFAHLTPLTFPDAYALNADIFSDYIGQFTAAGRLLSLVDPSMGWDGPRFFQENIMLLPFDELFIHNHLTEWNGGPQFTHLSRTRSEPVDRSDPDQASAEAFVETVLERSLIAKMSQAQGLLPDLVQLAAIWDRPENDGADVAPGTWAEYLRWASAHLEQDRQL
ncbi:hypothetical protein EXIGLDRAFT_565934, partial [Exidia glandulosa HHB12029]